MMALQRHSGEVVSTLLYPRCAGIRDAPDILGNASPYYFQRMACGEANKRIGCPLGKASLSQEAGIRFFALHPLEIVPTNPRRP